MTAKQTSRSLSPPVDQQETLFSPPPRCTARGCEAGDRRSLCGHDADLAAGIRDPYTRRPRGCINTAQLGPDDELPY